MHDTPPSDPPADRLPGLLLAFEGVDGSGKSTQIEELLAHARGRGLVANALREPGGTELGEELRRVLLERGKGVDDALLAALLFMASRRQLVLEKIRPALARGELIVLDRSFVSTWVYQGLVGGVESSFLEDLTRRVHGDAMPELILVLDLATEASRARRRARGAADAIEARGEAYLERIAAGFREIAARSERMRCVDAAGSVDEVAQRCLAHVAPLLDALEERQEA